MNYEVWHNIFQSLVVIFAILVALASFGSNYFSSKSAYKKEQQLNQNIEDLVTGKNELISQNKDLSKQINEYKEDLKLKDQKIDELTKLAKKDLYKPLSSVIREQIVGRLKSENNIGLKEVIVSDINTNNNGKRIVGDLISLFNDSEINVKRGSTGMAFGTSVIKSQIKLKKESKPIAEKLCEILSPYLKTQFNGVFDDSLDDGTIHIIIRGVPLFHEDGSVEFQ